MAAPTQEYPPWLTPSPYPTTEPNGDVETATTIVYLPLTYYGPSIPLDGQYTYGGLTSPASTATQPTTTPSNTSPTATPTTSIPSSSSSSSSLSSSSPSSSSTTSSSLPSSSASSSSSSQSSTPASSSSGAPLSSQSGEPSSSGAQKFPNQAQLAGIIVGSVLLAVFIAVMAYCCLHRYKNRDERQRTKNMFLAEFFKRDADKEDDFEIINRGDVSPGEGSPRHSGEEADPFLNRSNMAEMGVRSHNSGPLRSQSDSMSSLGAAYTDPSPLSPLAARSPDQNSNSNSSGARSNVSYGRAIAGTQSSNGTSSGSAGTVSSYGQPLPFDRRIVGQDPSRRYIMSPEEQRNLDDSTVIHEADEPREDSPLMPPPRLVEPETVAMQGSLPLSKRSFTSNRSSLPVDADEAGMLQTARRVRLEDELGSPPQASTQANLVPSSSAPQRDAGWLGGLGLGGIAKRLSWLNNSPSPPDSRRSSLQTSNAPPSSWGTRGMTDRDVEAGRPLITNPSHEFRSQRGILGVGLGPGGERPQSGAQSSMNSNRSNDSGNTVYYDAVPELPEMARTKSAQTMSTPRVPTTLRNVASVEAPSSTGHSADVLDTPAPAPLHHFGSSSSLRDTTTDTNSSLGSKAKIPAFPPGLAFMPNPKAWQEVSGHTPSPGSYGAGAAEVPRDLRTSVTIDVLEDAPPIPQRAWHHIVGFNIPTGRGQRTTFGGAVPEYGHSHERTSEHGSLHSNTSHLSPAHSRSAAGSSGNESGSSRRSRRTGSSSLSHSGSISEDGRRRLKLGATNRSGTLSPMPSMGGGPTSPALSAVGEGEASPPMSPMSSRALSPVRGSVSPPPPRSPRSPSSVSQMPWAAGLDHAWNPT